MTNISIITASTGHNLTLATTIKTTLQQKKTSTNLLNLVDENLPLYTPTFQKEHGIPKQVLALTTQLLNTKAFIFVAPEYNGGIPPTLVNLIAWVSVSTENWRDCFNGKIAAIATHSGSGGVMVLAAMRQQLSYIGLTVLGRQLHTNYAKPLNTESLEDVLNQLIKNA